jgi:hypothetical protein
MARQLLQALGLLLWSEEQAQAAIRAHLPHLRLLQVPLLPW